MEYPIIISQILNRRTGVLTLFNRAIQSGNVPLMKKDFYEGINRRVYIPAIYEMFKKHPEFFEYYDDETEKINKILNDPILSEKLFDVTNKKLDDEMGGNWVEAAFDFTEAWKMIKADDKIVSSFGSYLDELEKIYNENYAKKDNLFNPSVLLALFDAYTDEDYVGDVETHIIEVASDFTAGDVRYIVADFVEKATPSIIRNESNVLDVVEEMHDGYGNYHVLATYQMTDNVKNNFSEYDFKNITKEIEDFKYTDGNLKLFRCFKREGNLIQFDIVDNDYISTKDSESLDNFVIEMLQYISKNTRDELTANFCFMELSGKGYEVQPSRFVNVQQPQQPMQQPQQQPQQQPNQQQIKKDFEVYEGIVKLDNSKDGLMHILENCGYDRLLIFDSNVKGGFTQIEDYLTGTGWSVGRDVNKEGKYEPGGRYYSFRRKTPKTNSDFEPLNLTQIQDDVVKFWSKILTLNNGNGENIGGKLIGSLREFGFRNFEISWTNSGQVFVFTHQSGDKNIYLLPRQNGLIIKTINQNVIKEVLRTSEFKTISEFKTKFDETVLKIAREENQPMQQPMQQPSPVKTKKSTKLSPNIMEKINSLIDIESQKLAEFNKQNNDKIEELKKENELNIQRYNSIKEFINKFVIACDKLKFDVENLTFNRLSLRDINNHLRDVEELKNVRVGARISPRDPDYIINYSYMDKVTRNRMYKKAETLEKRITKELSSFNPKVSVNPYSIGNDKKDNSKSVLVDITYEISSLDI